MKRPVFDMSGFSVTCKPLMVIYLPFTTGLSFNIIVHSLHRSKFGLYHVDYNDTDRKRTPKQSSYFMRRITRTRRIPPIYRVATRKLDKLEGL